jgi:hypothetical protein
MGKETGFILFSTPGYIRDDQAMSALIDYGFGNSCNTTVQLESTFPRSIF